jgi:hypothetical protein
LQNEAMKKIPSLNERLDLRGASSGLRRSSFLAASSVGTSALATGFSLMATVMILRFLPRAEAGKFAVLIELLYGLGLLGSLGQAVLQARLYHREAPGHFDWRADLRSTIWITTPAIALGVLAIAFPYRLTIFQMAFLLVGAELFVLTNCASAVLAQQRRYAWSSALLRLPNGLLIFPALLMMVRPSFMWLDFVLVSLLIFLLLTTMLGVGLLARSLEAGRARITLPQRLSGFVFLVSMIALLVPQRGLIVVAGAILSPENIAALAALGALLRVFELVGDPAGRVFSTEMAQHSGRIGFGVFAAPWLLAGIISVAALLVFPPLAHRFYAGRYDFSLPFLSWLVAAAALRFVEIVPRGVLGYLAPGPLLNRFSIIQCAIAVLGLVLMVKWTADYGFRGIIWASTLIAAARVAISYSFLGKVLRRASKNDSSVETGERALVKPFEVGSEEPPI